MPRKTTIAEVEQYMGQFFEEATAGLMQDILKTQMHSRREALLSQIDALDKVKARFYNWLTAKGEAA